MEIEISLPKMSKGRIDLEMFPGRTEVLYLLMKDKGEKDLYGIKLIDYDLMEKGVSVRFSPHVFDLKKGQSKRVRVYVSSVEDTMPDTASGRIEIRDYKKRIYGQISTIVKIKDIEDKPGFAMGDILRERVESKLRENESFKLLSRKGIEDRLRDIMDAYGEIPLDDLKEDRALYKTLLVSSEKADLELKDFVRREYGFTIYTY